jgi:hypothetical protein
MFTITTHDKNGTSLEIRQSLDDAARDGARRMIANALQLEVEDYLEEVRHLRDERGHAVAVRNGKARERTIQMGASSIRMWAPKLHHQRPDERFTRRILPPYVGRSPRPRGPRWEAAPTGQ